MTPHGQVSQDVLTPAPTSCNLTKSFQSFNVESFPNCGKITPQLSLFFPFHREGSWKVPWGQGASVKQKDGIFTQNLADLPGEVCQDHGPQAASTHPVCTAGGGTVLSANREGRGTLG